MLEVREDASIKALGTLREISEKYSVSMASMGLHYLTRKPEVASVLLGVRTLKQLTDNLEAVDLKINLDDLDLLNIASKPHKPYPHWIKDKFARLAR